MLQLPTRTRALHPERGTLIQVSRRGDAVPGFFCGDGGTKVATFSSPAASFAAMAEDINQKKKGGKTGRLRRSMDGQIANAKPPTPARFELQIDFKQGEPVRAKIKAQSKKSKKKSKPKSKR